MGSKAFCTKFFPGNRGEKHLEATTAYGPDMPRPCGLYNFGYKMMAELGGTTVEIVHSISRNNMPNERLFDYIRERLKSKYKIGLLSNVGLGQLFSNEDLGLLTTKCCLLEVGMTKPNPEIYKLAAVRLGADPKECDACR